MNSLNRFNLQTRLIVGSAIPILLLVGILLIGVTTNRTINDSYQDVTDTQVPILRALDDLKLAGTTLTLVNHELLLEQSYGRPDIEFDTIPESIIDEAALAEIASVRADYDDALSRYMALVEQSDEQQATLLAEIERTGTALLDNSERLIILQQANASQALLIEAQNNFAALEEDFFAAVDAAIEVETQRLLENEQQVDDTVTTASLATTGLGILAIVIAIGAAVVVTRSITEPLSDLRDTTQKLAAGQMGTRAHVNNADEVGELAKAFNDMADTIEVRERDLETANKQLAAQLEELKEARRRALAAQRIAQENSRLKSEFLSTMSHELRTPLNAIEGFTSIMLSGMGVELSPRAEDMVKRVSSNSKRLLSLINDFLDLSRIESGRLELVATPLSPQELTNRWRQEIGVIAANKSLKFDVNIAPDMPAEVLGDEDALTKITTNLLSNAFKFTKAGGVTLDIRPEGIEDWAIVVTDTGIGIPAHAREYIFDEFRQVDGSTTREFGGTGLGLSLVQKLARAMGGQVTLDSEVGKGSTFTVVLPLKPQLEEVPAIGD